MNAMTQIATDPDDLYARAVAHVRDTNRASTTYLQRTFSIGYNRAAQMIERMEAEGVVSPADPLGKREVFQAARPDETRLRIIAGGAQVETSLGDMQAAAERISRAAGRPPMKQTEADRAVSSRAYNVAADELRQFIEQFEHLDAEKQEIAGQQKDVMSEAKARGYNTKVIRKIIAIRKRDKDDVAEEDAILDLYKAALGMS